MPTIALQGNKPMSMSITANRPGAPARARALAAGALAIGAAALSAPSSTQAASISPLPASNYSVRAACAAPALGHGACLALTLMPRSPAARAHTHPVGIPRSLPTPPLRALSPAEGGYGLRPEDLRAAYFHGEQPTAPAAEPQTIALVDAYHDSHALSDLNTYSRAFSLPELARCSGTQGDCFEQINEFGQTTNPPFPASEAARRSELEACQREPAPGEEKAVEAACERVIEADGWALEISTDVEVAHAICNNCKILLVEANSSAYPDLEAAEEAAASARASEISNSWGGPEPERDSAAFDHPGTVVTASSGDAGYLNWVEAAAAAGRPYNAGADYPASSPRVLAVGGTRLTLSAGSWQSETVWNDHLSGSGGGGAAGSGCSQSFGAPVWQLELPDWTSVGCMSKRAVADVSADADPHTGAAVYDSAPYIREEGGAITETPLKWLPIGGTSVSSPIIASMFALAGGAHGVSYPAATVYAHAETELLHAISAGGSGECADSYTGGCTGSMNAESPRRFFDCGEGVMICNAAAGCLGSYYSGPAGLGTPSGVAAFKPEQHPAKDATPCQPKPEAPLRPESPAKPEANLSKGSRIIVQPPPVSGTGGGGSSSSSTLPRIWALSLTRAAIISLNRARPRAFRIAFQFILSAPAHIRVSLAKRRGTGRHARWQVLPDSLSMGGAKGRNSRRLPGRNALSRGLYRLTVTPSQGAARSILLHIG